jgi:hypothetical protein
MLLARTLAGLLFLLTASAPLVPAATVFNFDADTVGKGTPFTDTVGGLSATFSSSGDPGGFVIATTFFKALTGNVLFEPGPAGVNNLTLTVLFSVPQTNISLNFATNSAPGVLFNLNAFNNAAAVGSVSEAGVIPPGFSFPEGLISFTGSTFNRVVLSSPALDFSIDNVTVNAGTTVPEPGTLAFFMLAALAAPAVGRIRKGAAAGCKVRSRVG